MKRIVTLAIAAIIALTGTFGIQEAYAAEASNKSTTTVTVDTVKNLNVKLYSSNKVTVSWNKHTKADGYQIVKKLSNGKWEIWKTIKDEDTVKYKTATLYKGKTYTFGVKAYRIVDGKKVYSKIKYSSVYIPKVMTRNTKGFSDTTAGKLIKTAKGKLGCRYVSGAAGPSKFDCSGFVYYITKKADVSTTSFSRTTAAGTWSKLMKYSIGSTKLSKAQPGDIVFTASMGGSRITHTAFYYGDNKYIHATNPKQGVTITPASYYGKVIGIVRLPNL
jgi:cell wall-associated NlpC family hydrolase